MKQEKVSLISLDNAFDDRYVYDRLKVGQHSLLHALIRIFNRLKYPEFATISNIELQRKCGIESNHFQRVRESLLKFLVDPNDPNSWIVSYEAGEKQSAGKYTFNFSYLNLTTTLPEDYHDPTTTLPADIPQVYHDVTTAIPKVPENVNDHRKKRSDQKEENRKDSLSSSNDHSNEVLDSNSETENESESDFYDNFKKGQKIIEGQYQTFFVNNASRGLSKDQKEMIALMGSNEKAEGIFKIKAMKARNPLNAIIWTAEELSVNKKQKEKEDEHIDIRAIWNDQDAMFSLITLKNIAYRDDFLQIASRLTELYKKAPEDAYGGLKEFFLDIKVEEFIKFHSERIVK